MIRSIFAVFLSISLLTSIGCNNQTDNRLSAAGACDSSFRSVDPTAYTPDEDQAKLLTLVDPKDFPDSEALEVVSIVSTFEIALDNEERAIVRLNNSDVPTNKNTWPALCVRNISPTASAEKIVEMPISNENGNIQLQRFRIEIGNPTKEDQSDFIRITAIKDEVDESAESDNAETAPPVPFSDYFSAKEDQVTYYKLIGDGKEKTEEERLEEKFFIHYKNDVDRVRSRITVSRIIETEKK